MVRPVDTSLAKVNSFLSALSRRRIAAIVLVLVLVVGSMDYATGYELSFWIFYLVPIAIASWYINRRFAVLVSIFSAITWLALDQASGSQYSKTFIPFWNAGVRLMFFLTTTFLINTLRNALDLQKHLAQIDGLTCLANSRTFKQRFRLLRDLAARHHHSFALGYLDIDNFKNVNDILGHSVGDQVLREVAATLKKWARDSDVLARLGGDEFAILLPETNRAGASTFFSKLHSHLQEIAATKGWPIGFSIGVVVFNQIPSSVDEAIHLADQVMYEVKNSGKNAIRIE